MNNFLTYVKLRIKQCAHRALRLLSNDRATIRNNIASAPHKPLPRTNLYVTIKFTAPDLQETSAPPAAVLKDNTSALWKILPHHPSLSMQLPE